MIGNLQDTLNLISKFTVKRSFNAAKVIGGYYSSKLSRRTIHPAYPISISVEPTTSCNLRCPECPSGLRAFSRPTGMMDLAFFQDVMDEIHEQILYVTFYFQGEPYLNPAFTEMVKYAAKKKIYTATSTNAHFLDDESARRTVESGLDRLIISIDGSTQETYEKYRVGGNLDKVIDGARNLVKWKKAFKSSTPYLIFQCLSIRPNEHQHQDLKRFGKEIGIDRVVFKTAQVADYKNGNDLIPLNEKHSRYHRQNDGTFMLNNKLENHCWKLWQSCVITWDGTVVPCCFDKDASHPMGTLKEKSFREIWNNEAYQKFRATLMNGRKEIDICRNCTEGTRVWT